MADSDLLDVVLNDVMGAWRNFDWSPVVTLGLAWFTLLEAILLVSYLGIMCDKRRICPYCSRVHEVEHRYSRLHRSFVPSLVWSVFALFMALVACAALTYSTVGHASFWQGVAARLREARDYIMVDDEEDGLLDEEHVQDDESYRDDEAPRDAAVESYRDDQEATRDAPVDDDDYEQVESVPVPDATDAEQQDPPPDDDPAPVETVDTTSETNPMHTDPSTAPPASS